MDLVDFAHANGQAATNALSVAEQKKLGQFMTPCAIALTMARRACSELDLEAVRILEPAAGCGILASAVIKTLLEREIPPRRIELTLIELDARLMPVLRRLANRMRKVAHSKGVELSVSIKTCDFLLSTISTNRRELFDLIISNPPYFKLKKSAPQAVAHAYAVYGQPNIYGLFMAACAQLLSPGGKWCFITPRSWTNGAYFASVRRHMLAWLRIDAMHVFESREAHFTDDEILQEAMITWATAQAVQVPTIILSMSQGIHDLAQAHLQAMPIAQIIGGDNERTIALPLNGGDQLAGCTSTLESLGLKVSTGPVVAFRATEFCSEYRNKNTVPLLWMQHISHMKISWPINKKREHIAACSDSAWMLVPNSPMVLLRRFSPKEDIRRVTAAAYIGELPGDQIGLENHLNYIYRPGGLLTVEESIGISAFLNSQYVDHYFRAVAGSTQVNATELRKLPMPSIAQLAQIARQCQVGMSLAEIDACIEFILQLENLQMEAA